MIGDNSISDVGCIFNFKVSIPKDTCSDAEQANLPGNWNEELLCVWKGLNGEKTKLWRYIITIHSITSLSLSTTI